MGPIQIEVYVDIFIERSLPGEHLERSRKILSHFCPQGQTVIACLMVKAAEKQRLEAAFILLDDYYEKHWKQQPENERGNPHSNTANHRWINRIYTLLGLSGSWESKPELGTSQDGAAAL